jgi:hypothetical protein
MSEHWKDIMETTDTNLDIIAAYLLLRFEQARQLGIQNTIMI